MAVLGTFNPKIVGDTTVEFDYSVLKRLDMNYETVKHENNIDGEHAMFTRGDDSIIRIQFLEHIYKYGNPTTKFTAIEALFKNNVTFYFDNDGGVYFKDAAGDAVPFYFEQIEWVFLEEYTFRDALLLSFVSTGFVDMTETT